MVFHAIHAAELRIPEDIAVISVDNINQICLNVTPNLTSVIVNFPKAGENAIFHRETGMSMRDWKKAHSGE